MGANFVSFTLKGTQAEVRKQFDDAVQQSLFSDGHEYSGEIGMANGLKFCRLDRVHTPTEANEWLQENAQKWEEALAVRLTDDQWAIGAWCSS